jgi:hypothetical protein
MFRLFRKTAFAGFVLTLSVSAHAAAVLESVTGDIRVTAGGQKPAAVKQGSRINSGTTITTGTNGMVILKFDDEQKIALAPNSELTIVDFNYNPKVAAADRSELALNRGAARIVTGQVAKRNYEMFVLRTPHVNLGVRGTDFSTTIIGQSYWAVIDGAVSASTNVGVGVYGKGAYGRSQSLDRLASGVSAAGLPVAVLALFNELNSPRLAAQLGPGVGGPQISPEQAQAQAKTNGRAATEVGASSGISGTTLAIIAGALAILAAAGGGGGGGSSSNH